MSNQRLTRNVRRFRGQVTLRQQKCPCSPGVRPCGGIPPLAGRRNPPMFPMKTGGAEVKKHWCAVGLAWWGLSQSVHGTIA